MAETHSPSNKPGNSCSATRKDGHPCRATPTHTGYCLAHDPELEQKRCAARRNGGTNSARRIRLARNFPSRLAPVFERLLEAIEEIHAGSLEPRQAQAMASLASAAVRVLEGSDLEDRIKRLEEGRDGSA